MMRSESGDVIDVNADSSQVMLSINGQVTLLTTPEARQLAVMLSVYAGISDGERDHEATT